MRKLFIFLLLLGVGLGVLIWYDSQTKRSTPSEGASERQAPTPPEPDPRRTELPGDAGQPLTGPPGAEAGGETGRPTGQDAVQAVIDGRVVIQNFDLERGGFLVYELTIDDVDQHGSGPDTSFTFNGVTVQENDPETGEQFRTISARRAKGTLTTQNGIEFHLANDGYLLLEGDVSVRQETNLLYAPVTVTAERMEGWLDTQVFKTSADEPVTVIGQGLNGQGFGLDLDGLAGRATILRGGWVVLPGDQGRLIRFDAQGGGPLTLARQPQIGPNALRITADGGARLTASGEPALDLSARSVRVDAERDAAGVFHPGRAEVSGDVVALRGGDRYSGKSGFAEFHPDGTLRALVIEEEPVVALNLIDADGVERLVSATGRGPLDVSMGAVLGGFTLKGPGRVESAEDNLTFEFQDRLESAVTATRDEGSFEAFGDVIMRQGEQTLEAETLEAFLYAVEPRTADVLCAGETRMRALDESGNWVELDVAGGLRLEVRGEAWFVPNATGVECRFLGQRPFNVNVGSLHDLDVIARTFRADGGVRYVGALGTARGASCESFAGPRVLLEGDATTPASLVLLPVLRPGSGLQAGTMTAGALEFTEEWAEGRGRLHVLLADRDGAFELLAEHARIDSPTPSVEGTPREFELVARDVERASFTVDGNTHGIEAEVLNASGRLILVDGQYDAQVEELLALGRMHAEVRGVVDLDLDGHELLVKRGEALLLRPNVGERVRLAGFLPGNAIAFDLVADSFEAGPQRVLAIGPDGWFEAPLLPGVLRSLAPGEDPRTRFVAGRFEATPERIWISGGVEAEGLDVNGARVKLQAQEIEVRGELVGSGQDARPWAERIDTVEANGDFRLSYGGLGRARGARLEAKSSGLEVRGAPAIIETLDIALESSRIHVDLDRFLLDCDRGAMRSTTTAARWSLAFSALRPVEMGDDTQIVIASPLYQELERSARAHFATAWLRTEIWQARGRELLLSEPAPEIETPLPLPAPADKPRADLIQEAFKRLADGELPRYMRAALIEGEVEVSVAGQRAARADAIYTDLDTGIGWMRGAELSYDIEVGKRSHRMRIRTDELRTTLAGSLRAEKAILTTCTHDEPHFVIQTGVLELTARQDGRWRFSAEKNRIVFRRGIQLPLPPIRNVILDESGDFVGIESESGEVTTVDNIVLANTPRFGTTIRTVLAFDIGNIGQRIAKLFSFDTSQVQGKWKFDGAYLSSRGPLASVGLELRQRRKAGAAVDPEAEDFWLNMWVRGIPDEGTDRGIVRVEEEDRSTFRNWFTVRGRYPFSDTEWIDLVVNTQNDPGVQAEFFEKSYLAYEERDNYLHWRKARGDRYYDARVQWKLDKFRREVEQLPKLGAYSGLATIGKFLGQPLLYEGSVDLAHLRRREGDPIYEGEFIGLRGTPDNLGERSVVRANTVQRLEWPVETGLTGLRSTPFAEGHLTAWDEGVDESETPLRAGLFGGVEFDTTLIKSGSGGYHVIAPRARYTHELAVGRRNGLPVNFDEVEDPIDGNRVELGVRSLWRRPATGDRLDLELVGTRQTERFGSLPTQQRVAMLGGFKTEINRLPIGVSHDGRYDPDTGEALYSHSVLALRPSHDLITQFGHVRGLDADRERLYEAATVQARYRLNPKWEFEVTNWFALAQNQNLRSSVTVRRFAHDFVLEMSVLHISGEGGTGIGLNFLPLLTYTPDRLGMLDDDPDL